MSAMDNASKNAGTITHLFFKVSFTHVTFFSAEMIDKLTLTFNRTRQAVITGELIEIISGAAAL